MNKIFRIFPKGNDTATAIGFLLNETDNAYIFRVQNGKENTEQTFDKNKFNIKSIYEVASDEMYQIKTSNSEGKNIIVELPKSCFGGCG